MSIKKLTKQETAIRQLGTAICLYAQDKDEVSVHTLTAASFEVIRGVGKNKPIVEKIRTSVSIMINSWTFLQKEHQAILFEIIWDAQIKLRKLKKKGNYSPVIPSERRIQ